MVDPDDFLKFTEDLYSQIDSENDSILVRNCISRSYYYIFHKSRTKFKNDSRTNFSTYPNSEQHREIVNFFHNINHHDIANKIKRFRQKRNDADYELEMSFNKNDANSWIKTAKQLNGRISRIGIR